MFPNEKASELLQKFDNNLNTIDQRKEAAIICCEEILKILEGLHKPEYTSFDIFKPKQYHLHPDESDIDGYGMIDYWEEVVDVIKKTE